MSTISTDSPASPELFLTLIVPPIVTRHQGQAVEMVSDPAHSAASIRSVFICLPIRSFIRIRAVAEAAVLAVAHLRWPYARNPLDDLSWRRKHLPSGAQAVQADSILRWLAAPVITAGLLQATCELRDALKMR